MASNASTVNQMVNRLVNHLVKCVQPALSDDCLLQLVDCRESSTLINHLLKGTPHSAIDWIQVRAVWRPHVRLDERSHAAWYVGVFLAVRDGAMQALLLPDVTVTFLLLLLRHLTFHKVV